jgi:hypothetical protein
MIDKLFKNFRKRLKRSSDTLDDQLSNSSVPDEVSSDAPSYEMANASRTIAIWEPPVAERIANESEAERLQRQIEELDEQLLGLEQGILQMKQKLDDKFPHLVGELYTLRAQLEAEFLRLTEGQRNEEFARDDDDRDHNGLTPEEQAELNRIEAKVNGETAESRKRREEYEAQIIIEGTKVYRQIAMRSHPDRTSNKAFHAMFKEAKDAYENRMWGRLHELWDILGPKKGNNPSKLFEALMSRLGVLREELRKKEQALVALKSDKDFGMYRDYQVPAYRGRVEAHYKALLEYNIRQTKQVLASMGAQDYESFLRTEVQKDIVEDMMQPSSSSLNEMQRKSTQARAADRYFKTHSVMNEKVDQELDSPWVDED